MPLSPPLARDELKERIGPETFVGSNFFLATEIYQKLPGIFPLYDYEYYFSNYLEFINNFLVYFYKVNNLVKHSIVVAGGSNDNWKLEFNDGGILFKGGEITERLIRTIISYFRDKTSACYVKYSKEGSSLLFLYDLFANKIGLCVTFSQIVIAVLETLGWFPNMKEIVCISMKALQKELKQRAFIHR